MYHDQPPAHHVVDHRDGDLPGVVHADLMKGIWWGLLFSVPLWALIVLGACLVAPSVGAEDAAVGEARFALDYLEGHLPAGVVLPAAMKAQGAYILACENRELDAKAVSDTGDFGLFQLNKESHEKRVQALGYTWAEMFDPHKNTHVAITIWEDAQRFHGWGFKPWTCRTAIP